MRNHTFFPLHVLAISELYHEITSKDTTHFTTCIALALPEKAVLSGGAPRLPFFLQRRLAMKSIIGTVLSGSWAEYDYVQCHEITIIQIFGPSGRNLWISTTATKSPGTATPGYLCLLRLREVQSTSMGVHQITWDSILHHIIIVHIPIYLLSPSLLPASIRLRTLGSERPFRLK